MILHLRFIKIHKMFHSLVHTNHKSPNHHCMKYIPKKKRKYMPGISVSFFINYNELKKLINYKSTTPNEGNHNQSHGFTLNTVSKINSHLN